MPRSRIQVSRLVGCTAVAFLLQSAVMHRFSPGWGRVDPICLLAAFLALEARPPGALWAALGLGLLRDLGSTGPLGAGALGLLPAAALLLLVRGRFYRSPAVDVGLALAFLLCFSILEAAVTMFCAPGSSATRLLRIALGQSLFSAALAFPLFWCLKRIGLVQKSRMAFAE